MEVPCVCFAQVFQLLSSSVYMDTFCSLNVYAASHIYDFNTNKSQFATNKINISCAIFLSLDIVDIQVYINI